MRDADGRQRKLIVFTEHKDTLNYLERKIGGVLGTPDAITTIHGSVHRDERRKRQEMFRSDPEVRILLATDAAGEVYHRLLTKLETINEAFHGRVFDILGEVFEERSLKDLLLDAIRYNDQPERAAERLRTIDHAFDTSHIKDLLDRNALAQQTMSAERLFTVKEQMEIAEDRRVAALFRPLLLCQGV